MSLGEDREANTDILSIGRSVAAFFESRENPGHSRVLGQLCERLAIRTAEGTSHLVLEEYEDLCPDPSVFSAIGKPGDFSPLILTGHKKLYFQKYFESRSSCRLPGSRNTQKNCCHPLSSRSSRLTFDDGSCERSLHL